MPKAWSEKRERQYQHIQKAEKGEGRSTAAAKRIAAATVNKTRRKKGETKGAGRTRAKARGGAKARTGSKARGGAAKARAVRKTGRTPARKPSRR